MEPSPEKTTEHPPGALNTLESPTPRPDLEALSLVDLSMEMVARLSHGQTYERDKDLVLAGQLQDLLESRLDVHLNRFSRRRFFDLVSPILERVPTDLWRGGTVVDLGSGSLNPLVFGFLFIMMGAKRAYAIDLEPAQDLPRAVRALATAASWMLIDPRRAVGSDTFRAESVLEHLRGFDLARLSAGDAAGIPADRLMHKVESIYDLSLQDGEAALVSSVSLLEHVDRIEDALESLRRITRPGGIGHHVVDFIDHRFYGGEVPSPFEFLKIEGGDPIVHGCNRIRADQMCAMFRAHGFEVVHVDPFGTAPLSDEEQRLFAEPYRSMKASDVAITCARIVVRRQ